MPQSVGDEDICNLVQKLEKEIEDKGLLQEDIKSICALACSIIGQEVSKKCFIDVVSVC